MKVSLSAKSLLQLRSNNPLVLLASVFFLLGVKVGDLAPEFALKNQAGKPVSLSASMGHPVLIYFYPKDETPGCTEEACTLRDTFVQFQKRGVVIFGVSTQDVESHQKFRAHHQLPFDLLVDPHGEVAAKFGVHMMIPGSDLLERKSVLIGPDGHIFRMYEKVNPSKHAQEILADLNALKI